VGPHYLNELFSPGGNRIPTIGPAERARRRCGVSSRSPTFPLARNHGDNIEPSRSLVVSRVPMIRIRLPQWRVCELQVPVRKHRRFVRGFMSIACVIVARITRDRDRRAVDRRLSVIPRPLTAGACPPGPTKSGGSPCGRIAPATPKMLAHRPRPQRSARAAHARGWNHEIAHPIW
jgi:hypothetical protein